MAVDWSFVDYVPTSDADLVEKCLSSKLWRMNNIYKVKNKLGDIVTFRMNGPQRKVAEAGHNRKIILKSRQVGISTYHLLYNLDEAIFYGNLTNGVMAQGLIEAEELLEKARLAFFNLDDSVMEFLGLLYGKKFEVVVNNSQEFSFNNGSKLMVRTSFRSGTLQNLHVSELGKISAKDPQKAKELKTGTFQAIGGKRKVTVESTAEGKSGYFYELWSQAETHTGQWSELDFYPIFISWIEDPDCVLDVPQVETVADRAYFSELGLPLTQQQKWFYIAKKRELGADITQEYPSTAEEAFAATRDGTYYGAQVRAMKMSGRVRPDLYDSNLEVYIAMDLGMNDSFSIVFYQLYKKELRVIDEYESSGEGLAHYARIIHEKPYRYGDIYGPHDLAVKELGTGKSRQEVFWELGINVVVLTRMPVVDGIEALRLILANTYIDSSCGWVLESLENYTKEWDDGRGVWKDRPLHDKYSHMADACRYMGMSPAVHRVFVSSKKFIPKEKYVRRRSGFDL